MAVIADYLTQLESDKDDLVNNLETQGITGLTGDETFTELVPEVLNIQSASSIFDLSLSEDPETFNFGEYLNQIMVHAPMIDTSGVIGFDAVFANFENLETVPLYDTSSAETMYGTFQNCTSLVSIPQFNTSLVVDMNDCFSGCSSLENVPLLDTSSCEALSNTFYGCPSLTDASLDNILQMCYSSAISISELMTLTEVGFDENDYPTSRIEALPHYQDFVDANWTIGY